MVIQIKKGVFLVKGASRSAILDSNTKDVYSINDYSYQVINGLIEDKAFIDQLIEKGLLDDNASNLKCDIPLLGTFDDLGFCSKQFIWFELNPNECNQRCMHCYEGFSLNKRGQLNKSTSNTKTRMRHEDWLAAISAAKKIGWSNCQFIGGEPFLYAEPSNKSVLDLAEFARDTGFKGIEIFTNSTYISDDQIKRIKELELDIATTLFSHNSVTHDSVTQVQGSFQKTVETIKKMVSSGIKVRAEIIVMNVNQADIEKAVLFREELGCSGGIDVIRPFGNESLGYLQPEFQTYHKYALRIKPNFIANRNGIYKSLIHNRCLHGKLVLSQNGSVFPCVFDRDNILGNILAGDSLYEIVEKEYTQSIWNSSIDEVSVCKDCEYRYVCNNCRPLSKASYPNCSYYTSPNPRCTYNPYTGEWNKGLWAYASDDKFKYVPYPLDSEN